MVELKVVKRGRKINLSPHQYSFHLKHADLRCPTFILVQYFPPHYLISKKADLFLYRGAQAKDLFEHGLDVEPIASWPFEAVDWLNLRNFLST